MDTVLLITMAGCTVAVVAIVIVGTVTASGMSSISDSMLHVLQQLRDMNELARDDVARDRERAKKAPPPVAADICRPSNVRSPPDPARAWSTKLVLTPGAAVEVTIPWGHGLDGFAIYGVRMSVTTLDGACEQRCYVDDATFCGPQRNQPNAPWDEREFWSDALAAPPGMIIPVRRPAANVGMDLRLRSSNLHHPIDVRIVAYWVKTSGAWPHDGGVSYG